MVAMAKYSHTLVYRIPYELFPALSLSCNKDNKYDKEQHKHKEHFHNQPSI